MKKTFLTFAVMIGVVGCSGKPITSDKAVVSQAVSSNQALTPAVIEDPQLASYFQSLGERIIASAKQLDAQHVGPRSHFASSDQWMFSSNMKFHLVNSKTINAFTTGGEHMYIYNGLFQLCKSEDELAAVMSHEYAHVYSRHVQKGEDRQYALMGLTLGAAGAGYAYSGSGGASNAESVFGQAAQYLGMSFTRKDENEADKFGFMFYCRAGWDPNHFADFFKKMIQMGYDKTPAYASDHPTLASRVQATAQRVKELPSNSSTWRKPDIATPDQMAAMQARAQQIAASMPTSESLQKAQGLLASFSSCVSPGEDQPEQVRIHQAIAQAKQKNQ